jgi:arylsulfatase A-like enzyme
LGDSRNGWDTIHRRLDTGITTMRSLAAILYALVAFVGWSRAAEPLRPNFVVVVSDDHTYRAVGYRNPQVSTPHLDELASGGFRFDRFFVASPICVASRASLYSGVYPQQHGSVGLNARGFAGSVVEQRRFPPLAEVLGRAGYHTALYGKSHLGDPKRFGFAEGREVADRDDFETFAEARKFIERPENQQRPFLLWLTPHNPHVPLTAPAEFLERYASVNIQLDPNFREEPQKSSLFNQGLPGELYFRDSNKSALSGGPPRSAEQMKGFMRAYYAEVSLLDRQIGDLVQDLRRAGLYERTIFIYLSDNGYHLGNHGLGNKITMHEESVRVPCVFHSPLLPRSGVKSDALVGSLDIYPTLLDFAGAEPPPHLMGRSLRKILADPEAQIRDAIVSECVGVGGKPGQGHRMVRTDRFKYMLSGDNDEGFFDLQADPYELRNLAGDAQYGRQLQSHRERLTKWMNEVGDTHERPNSK